MTGLTAALDDYLTMRRALGYRLIRPEMMALTQVDQSCSSNFPTWWRCQL
jgi:hypothetical protein